MSTEIEEISKQDPLIDTVHYKGLSFPVYKDEAYYYTIVAGKRVNVCPTYTHHRHFIENLLDIYLGTIYEYPNGARLVKFHNGGYEDVKLIYGARAIKLFLLDRELDDTMVEHLVAEGQKVLDNYVELTKLK